MTSNWSEKIPKFNESIFFAEFNVKLYILFTKNRSAQRIIFVTYIYLFDEYFYPFIITTRIILPLHTELSCILER
jgi:hypothetical protein